MGDTNRSNEIQVPNGTPLELPTCAHDIVPALAVVWIDPKTRETYVSRLIHVHQHQLMYTAKNAGDVLCIYSAKIL